MKYLDLDLLENPYGARRGAGYDSVLVGPGGGRVHVKGKDGGPLCMQGRSKRDVRDSSARVVTCYRCIKIMMMEGNAPFVMRDLTTARGVKRKHLMVPGGREGQMVAQRDGHLSPFGLDGVEPFKRGPANHPTQGRMTKTVVLARSKPGSIREEGVARPAYYVPPEMRQDKEYVAELLKDVERGKRRMADKRRKAAKVAAAAAAAAEAPAQALLANPSNMGAIAMYVYRSGQAKSLADAYQKLRTMTPGLLDKHGDEIGYTRVFNERTHKEETLWWSPEEEHYENVKAGWYNNPRSSLSGTERKHALKAAMARMSAYSEKKKARLARAKLSDAALAMRFFHSGQASSLAKAWELVRERNEAETERLRGHANPATGRHARHGLPYMTFGNPGGWAWTVHATSPSAPPLDGSGTASSRESAVAAIKRFLSDYGDDYDTKKIKLVKGKARASGEEMFFLNGPTGKARGIATVEPV